MKTNLFCLFFILNLSSITAQKIYSTNQPYKADIKVFVVENEYQADLKVFFVDYKYQAKWKSSKKIPIIILFERIPTK